MSIVLGLAVAGVMAVPVVAMFQTIKFGFTIHSKRNFNHLLRPAHMLGVVFPGNLQGIIREILYVVPMPWLVDMGSWVSGDMVDGKFVESCWGRDSEWVSISGGWKFEFVTLTNLMTQDQDTEESTGCTFGLRYKLLGLFNF